MMMMYDCGQRGSARYLLYSETGDFETNIRFAIRNNYCLLCRLRIFFYYLWGLMDIED